MRRTLLYIVATPLALLFAAAAMLPLFLDEARLIQLATETLEERSGAKLTVRGDAGLSILPRLSLQLEDTQLELPGEQQPNIAVKQLSVEVFLLPLLSKEVAIKGIQLSGLEVTIPASEATPVSTTAGLSDAQLEAFYAERRKALRAAAEAGAGAALGIPLALNIANVVLSDARV
ncbi:MAG: AsmA family protein, partial [Haliea sp.]|nr:AsmA family protein [Haliea sp.]